MEKKVILADAGEEFRALLRQTVEKTGEFQVVGTTGRHGAAASGGRAKA